MNRKRLAMAVAGTFFGSAFLMADGFAAEQTAGAKGDALDSYHIEDVVVTGDRDTMPGGLIGRQAIRWLLYLSPIGMETIATLKSWADRACFSVYRQVVWTRW